MRAGLGQIFEFRNNKKHTGSGHLSFCGVVRRLRMVGEASHLVSVRVNRRQRFLAYYPEVLQKWEYVKPVP